MKGMGELNGVVSGCAPGMGELVGPIHMGIGELVRLVGVCAWGWVS